MSENEKTEPAAHQIQDGQQDMFALRKAKLEKWADAGVDPYGGEYPVSGDISKIRGMHEEGKDVRVSAAGRITATRDMGKSSFFDIRDHSGRVQVYMQKNSVGDAAYSLFKLLDIGDFVGVEGSLFVTRTGELSIKAGNFKILSKALRFLPEKWHGLTDIEQRYRQRYLDLVMNEDGLGVFKKRMAVIREIRNFLQAEDFFEVETPMLQPIPGGAAAKPFETFYEALHCKMFMRIAPELYLKRLLVGGFNKVFELNRNFRNEGISRKHNPEFTMIEIYQAYGSCRTMMDLVEKLVSDVALKVVGTLKIERRNGDPIDLTPPWKRADYDQIVREHAGQDWFSLDRNAKIAKARAFGLDVPGSLEDFEVTHDVYEKMAEPRLIQPTFVTKIPAVLVPLAKRCADEPDKVDVFELEINGQEIAPGYSELNNPIEQRERLEGQHGKDFAELKGKIDEDFLVALEHGMPPAGGMGIGIDRLVMLLAGAESIRDVILFPQLKPESR